MCQRVAHKSELSDEETLMLAMVAAQAALARYWHPGERSAEEALDTIGRVLDHEDVITALNRMIAADAPQIVATCATARSFLPQLVYHFCVCSRRGAGLADVGIKFVREHLEELERMVRGSGHHPLAALIGLAVLECNEILRLEQLRKHSAPKPGTAIPPLTLPSGKKP